MWPDETLEKVFTVFLDVILLIIPLLLMGVMYGLIVNHLWKVDQGKTFTFFSLLYRTVNKQTVWFVMKLSSSLASPF